jgi:hypothetical protein
LMIHEVFGFRHARINSVSLRTIYVRAQQFRRDELQLGNLVIENAPSLERLLHLVPSNDLSVSVIFAPKLETLCCHSYASTQIMFGSTVIQVTRVFLFLAITRLPTRTFTRRNICIYLPLHLQIA